MPKAKWRRGVLDATDVQVRSSVMFLVSSFDVLCQEWAVTLTHMGWPSSRDRLLVMSQFLVDCELSKWWLLEHAEDPSCWEGSEHFTEAELDILRQLTDIGKRAPRL